MLTHKVFPLMSWFVSNFTPKDALFFAVFYYKSVDVHHVVISGSKTRLDPRVNTKKSLEKTNLPHDRHI